jgi:hypothetical protein
MKKLIQFMFLGGALAAFACMSVAQGTQDTTPSTPTSPQAQQPAAPPTQTPDTQSQQPSSSPSQPQSGSQMDQQTPPSQTQQPNQPQNQTPPDTSPDSSGKTGNAGAASATGPQSFTGTIVKQGDKYMFQDSASGNMYDIDHQDEVSKYDGRKVKVRGVLDGSTHTIHLQ